ILFRLMPPALAGIFLGYWLLTQPWLNDIVIRKSIGVIVIALLILNHCRDRIRLDIGDGQRINAVGLTIAILFGITAGVTTMIANAAGPILLIYLLAMNLPKDEFIGTSAWYFLVLNWCKVPLMMHLGMINRDSMMFNLQLFPAVLVGALLGIALAQKMSNKSYTIWIQALTLVAALKLLF
ncbi:MAG TPA: sulfite exporter TauE/SafE family protein, partial [Lentisphaeria bacterium]|nr:sulfite exporter TauE/SafE family protein [Lentisphaeria bacterium]